MTRYVYGVDLESTFSAVDARDAIARCFCLAHDEVLRETMFSEQPSVDSEENEQIKHLDVELLLKRMFEKVGGDYDRPTKASLRLVVGGLQKFSENFRNQSVIEKHTEEIGLLLDKLPD